MPQISKTIIDKNLRDIVFDDIFSNENLDQNYEKVNDRQYGVLLYDMNDIERYVRIGVIVAEERQDMTARELMESEVAKYQATQDKKRKAAEERAQKAEADKQRRLEKKRQEEEKKLAEQKGE